MSSTAQKVVGVSVALLIAAIILPIGVQEVSEKGEWAAENTAEITNEELVASADNTKLNYSGELAQDYIIKGTVVISYTREDDGTTDKLYDTNDNQIDLDYTTGEYGFTTENYPEQGTTITVDYDYATSHTDWPAAVGTVLKTLLPVLAVIGVALVLIRKTDLV